MRKKKEGRKDKSFMRGSLNLKEKKKNSKKTIKTAQFIDFILICMKYFKGLLQKLIQFQYFAQHKVKR